MDKQKSKNLTIGLLAASSVLALIGCQAKKQDLADVIHTTAEYEKSQVTDPANGTLGGEWTVLALSRSPEKTEEDYWQKYLSNLDQTLQEKQGVLDERKYTEYSRVVLALASIGEDATDVGGYDLTEPLQDYDKVKAQGLNGPIFALMALRAAGQQDAPVTEQYIQYLTDEELPNGGYALSSTATEPDPDITAMALQALALYQDQGEADALIERGVQVLADLQSDDRGYESWEEESSESLSQVIIALSSLDIDCNVDERFVKDGKGLYDRLLKFAQKDGGYAHTVDGETDPMATDQALCALDAYYRYQNRQTAFYDMSDV